MCIYNIYIYILDSTYVYNMYICIYTYVLSGSKCRQCWCDALCPPQTHVAHSTRYTWKAWFALDPWYAFASKCPLGVLGEGCLCLSVIMAESLHIALRGAGSVLCKELRQPSLVDSMIQPGTCSHMHCLKIPPLHGCWKQCFFLNFFSFLEIPCGKAPTKALAMGCTTCFIHKINQSFMNLTAPHTRRSYGPKPPRRPCLWVSCCPIPTSKRTTTTKPTKLSRWLSRHRNSARVLRAPKSCAPYWCRKVAGWFWISFYFFGISSCSQSSETWWWWWCWCPQGMQLDCTDFFLALPTIWDLSSSDPLKKPPDKSMENLQWPTVWMMSN